MFGLGPQEIIILLGLGVLLFGKKLPDVGRSLGKGIKEFHNAVRGHEDPEEPAGSTANVPAEPPRPPQRLTTSVPKFEDPDPNEECVASEEAK